MGATIAIEPRPWLKKLGLGVAIGGPSSLLLIELAARGALDTQAVNQIVAWGPAGMILLGLYLLAERWAPRIVAAQTEGARAQQRMADSVTQLVERGDRDARETIGMVKYTLDEMQRMHQVTTAALAGLEREVHALGGGNDRN